jgi:hypothetical protein
MGDAEVRNKFNLCFLTANDPLVYSQQVEDAISAQLMSSKVNFPQI